MTKNAMVAVVRLGPSISLRNEKKGGGAGRNTGRARGEWLLRHRLPDWRQREQARGQGPMHRDLLLFLSVLGIAAAKAWAQPFARWRLSYLLLVALHLWIPVPLLEGQKNLSSTVQKAGANADMNAISASNLLQLRAQVCDEVVS